MENRFFRHVYTGVLLIGIILLAFWIRVQGTERFPIGQFTEHDAYLYYWQAGIIAEKGHLPERDMYRWLPLGRDNGQLLSLYAYAIAYLHKTCPLWSLYQIQFYLPPLCFSLGLSIIFLFLSRSYGVLFATLVSLLLATLPGSIERSAAGFGDRDAWCWMVGTLVVTSYLWKEEVKTVWKRYLATVLSGVTVFLGGLSWEGFGFFLLMIHAAELWKFCNTETDENLLEYFFWMLMFIPWLFFISPAYRSGSGFSTHVAVLMLAPPLVIFTLRNVRHLLLIFCRPLRPYTQKLAWGLTLIAVFLGVGFFLFQFDTFEKTAFAFRESNLMKNIEELRDPKSEYWINRYGTVFLSGSLGVMLASFHLWKWKSLPLAGSLFLFVGTTFFRDEFSGWIGSNGCDILFLISLGLTLLSLGYLAYLRMETKKNELVTLAMLAWFLLWVGLSRGGKRYDFFIGVPLAFFTAAFIELITNYLFPTIAQEKAVGKQNTLSCVRKMIVSCVILVGLMFFPPLGGYAKRTIPAATQIRKPIPGNSQMLTALHWINSELPRTAVIAAKWNYGTQLNVFGGVKTITDPDHYIPNWIYLYDRYVARVKSERQCLEFLKTHDATHLMLTHYQFENNPLLSQQQSKSFVPIYPSQGFSNARIKIWEIRYPPDIKPNPKYLAAEKGRNEK